MSEALLYFLLGAGVAIPTGYFTNVLFHKHHRPQARIYLAKPSGWRSWQSRFTRIWRRLRGSEIPQILVCTDGDFIDTAIFFLAAIEASKSLPEADITVRHVEWDNLKHVFGGDQNVIAYINRRHLPRIDVPVTVWCNLAAFKGYALLGRPPDFPDPFPTLTEANRWLQELARTRRLKIITNGADAVDVLNTPLTPLLNSQKVDIEVDPSADALDRFLRGRGDLFIAGLPQILSGKRAGMVEVLSSENNPLMLGIDAMVYEESRVPLAVLEQISIAWNRICRELASGEEHARKKYREWTEIAEEVGSRICFPEGDFVLVTCSQPDKYINFFKGRDDTTEEFMRASEQIMTESKALGLTLQGTRKALQALNEIYLGQASTN